MGILEDTNAKMIGALTGINIISVLTWIIGIALVGGAIFWYFGIYQRDKKIFRKKITAFEIVGINFVPSIRDLAKVVRVGTGGFEILYLKKQKVWKIAYGGRVGRDDYYFFILQDGYWYNGTLSSNVFKMNELGGLVPIVATNPTMRAQYTSLEKQIDSLHGLKTNFWDKYGSWVLSIAFVLIAGMMLWLCYKEFASAMGGMGTFIDKLTILIDKLTLLTGNMEGVKSGNGGLIPI